MANELRVRQNFLGGIIEDNPLTSGATTLTSSALAAVVAVGTTQHLPITLDPDGIYGEPEIVWVTAHTAVATTATILRAQEGTTAREHKRDINWTHGPTIHDLISTPVNPQTGTAYTLVLHDAEAFVTMTNAAASTLTVPPNSSVGFPIGTKVMGAQLGAGQVTLTPGAGVTINGTPGLKVSAQYGEFGLVKVGTDTWIAYGKLAA